MFRILLIVLFTLVSTTAFAQSKDVVDDTIDQMTKEQLEPVNDPVLTSRPTVTEQKVLDSVAYLRDLAANGGYDEIAKHVDLHPADVRRIHRKMLDRLAKIAAEEVVP